MEIQHAKGDPAWIWLGSLFKDLISITDYLPEMKLNSRGEQDGKAVKLHADKFII